MNTGWPVKEAIVNLPIRLKGNSTLFSGNSLSHWGVAQNKDIGAAPQTLLKVMLHRTIRNDDFYCNTALQHCCDIVSNDCNVVSTLQRYIALKIVVAYRPV